jgi:hypothetical protein
MARIATTVHRYKRPPRKRKAVPLAGPAIVRKANQFPSPGKRSAPELLATRSPANDDRKPAIFFPDGKKSAIVTTTSRKQAKLERATKHAESAHFQDGDPAATARVRAFFDRMIRPR